MWGCMCNSFIDIFYAIKDTFSMKVFSNFTSIQICAIITIIKFYIYFTPPHQEMSIDPLAVISHSFSLSHCALFSVSMDFITLGILCKWDHTMGGLLCLFIYSVFKVQSCGSRCWLYQPFFLWFNSILLYGYTTFCFSTS